MRYREIFSKPTLGALLAAGFLALGGTGIAAAQTPTQSGTSSQEQMGQQAPSQGATGQTGNPGLGQSQQDDTGPGHANPDKHDQGTLNQGQSSGPSGPQTGNQSPGQSQEDNPGPGHANPDKHDQGTLDQNQSSGQSGPSD